MRQRLSIRILPNGLSGFIVYWRDEFKILHNRKQLMRLLEILLDEDEMETEK